MYDHATQSLWSTLTGMPVVGPLVGKGIELQTLPVVTSTWGEWKKSHPGTSVLSLDTGHQRDHAEGAAYRQYFASDRLMFGVPKLDPRLPNKAEVLALRTPGQPAEQLAIAAQFFGGEPRLPRPHRCPGSIVRKRLPGHRAFWFGWYAAYPATRLVK